MTQNAPEAEGPDTLTQDEVSLAESQEQEQLNAQQKAYLQRRVVSLRVQNNRLQQQVDAMRAELDAIAEKQNQSGEDTDEDGTSHD